MVRRWYLMVDEYGPEIKYIKVPDNNAADAWSRLPLIKSDIVEINVTR